MSHHWLNVLDISPITIQVLNKGIISTAEYIFVLPLTTILSCVYFIYLLFFFATKEYVSKQDILLSCFGFYKNHIILYTFVYSLPFSLSILSLRFTESVLYSSLFFFTVLCNATSAINYIFLHLGACFWAVYSVA